MPFLMVGSFLFGLYGGTLFFLGEALGSGSGSGSGVVFIRIIWGCFLPSVAYYSMWALPIRSFAPNP